MKRIFVYILTLFLLLINTSANAAQQIVKKEIKAVAKDGFNINATLTYPRVKNQKAYSTVVLLHSLGYNSQWWEDLPKELLAKGYAVLTIDLRGHGESVYNKKLAKTSWKNLKNIGFAKYPSDILAIMKVINNDNTRISFFNTWAIVGADIGASAGVLAADNYPIEPKTIVMISPTVNSRGLYIPVSIAHLEKTDFLAISGSGDAASEDAEKYLSRFAQSEFMSFTSDSKTTGMLMLKNDPSLSLMITEWIFEYLN